MAAGGKQGLGDIAAALGSAEVVPISARAAGAAKPRKPSRFGDAPPDRGEPPVLKQRLPDNCPVVPLGTYSGLYYYLDELGQIRELKPKEHEKKNLESLFGRQSHLCEVLWPRYAAKPDEETGEPVINGWKPEVAGRDLMAACADRGIWRAQGRVRGAGAHRGDSGELILHCGDKVWAQWGDGACYKDPGLHGEHVYPASERTPRFAARGVGSDAGQRLLHVLSTWRWERPSIWNGESWEWGVDPMLMLGWMSHATICGAQDWRAAAWLTGGRGTGKSALQNRIIKPFFGRNGLLQAQNASEAYIRQLLGMRTLPVALDELEASADNRKVQAIIELARIASSGGTIGRGGQDHNPHEFTANSAFLFSSILTPPLAPQDRSRIAMLELREFEAGDKPPVIEPGEMEEIGLAVRRRMVDGWDRLEETIERYKTWLGQYGHDARMQDQFGTLLACADLVLFDDLSDDQSYYQAWAARLDARNLAEKAEDESEGELAARHIGTSAVQAVGGAVPETVSAFLHRAAGNDITDSGVDTARRRLETMGLKLISSWLDGEGVRRVGRPVPDNPDKPLFVAVANKHRGLDALTRDTRWCGGVWSQALKRLKGAVPKHNVKIAHRNEWCVLVPVSFFASIGEGEEQ
ncbi:MAG TPA: hypothetical protein VGB70_12795 [Allosphingosinicella sp.]|jgi:hypothetical protein